MVKTKAGNDIPEPYCWDASFEVFYKNLDEEHKGLFDGLFAVTKNMGDSGKLATLVAAVKAHFTNEEGMMDKSTAYTDVAAHKVKHVEFVKTLEGLSIPVDQGTCDFAKEWLVDHIICTDFHYKGKL